MSNGFRRIVAVTAATLLLATSLSATATAQTRSQGDAANAPAAVDLMLLRPAGFVGLIVGTGLFVVISPIVLITRPQDIGTPFDQLVVGPAKYLWVDPLGGH